MATASPPPSPPPTARAAYGRLHVWSATLAAALTALLLGLIAWPIRTALWRHAVRRGVWPGMTGVPAHPMTPHAMWAHPHPTPGLHLVAIVLVALWVGVGGAVFAALYNAFAPHDA